MSGSVPSSQEIDRAVLLINEVERCIKDSIKLLHMTQQQIINSISNLLNTPPPVIQSVWELLEEQNPQFFQDYARLVPMMGGLLPPEASITAMGRAMEACFRRDKTMQETMDELFTGFQIPPAFTQIVWEILEQKKPKFFRAYYARLENEDLTDSDGQSSNHSTEHMLDVKKGTENMTLNDAPSGSGHKKGVEHSQQKMMWTPTAGEQARSNTEKDLFDDDDDEFDIKQEGNDEETVKEITQHWEADWDDDDPDFKKELDKSK